MIFVERVRAVIVALTTSLWAASGVSFLITWGALYKPYANQTLLFVDASVCVVCTVVNVWEHLQRRRQRQVRRGFVFSAQHCPGGSQDCPDREGYRASMQIATETPISDIVGLLRATADDLETKMQESMKEVLRETSKLN